MKKVIVTILTVVAIILIGFMIIKFVKSNQNNNRNFNEEMSGDFSGEIGLHQSGEMEDNWLHNEIFMQEFTLISDKSKATLGADFKTFEKEPISKKEDRGDGFHWIDYAYDDINVTAMFDGDDVNQYIHVIETTSSNYETFRGIKVGDSLESLKNTYLEDLNQNIWNTAETEYVYYSPEKYGFNRIFFFLKNDVITRIRIENGIDG